MINIRRCEYVKTDGRLCGSPALRAKRYCYFHYEVNRTVAHLDIPPLEDGDAIQLALTDLARALVEDRIALKPAALLAYILQTASANLKHVHLGIHTDRMITELPARDPYARGLAPLPGERNRDPEHTAPSPSAPSAEKASASSAVQASDPPSSVPFVSSVVKKGPDPLSRKIQAARAGSLKDAKELLDLVKQVS